MPDQLTNHMRSSCALRPSPKRSSPLSMLLWALTPLLWRRRVRRSVIKELLLQVCAGLAP
jgi:hypothetical protein